MLLDRVEERAQLDRAIDAARNGLSDAVVLFGEAGIGKTALLEYAVTSATGLRVIRVVGMEAGRDLSFAGLDRLLNPFRADFHRLPSPQRDALAAAFGGVGGTAPDRFLVGLASLTLLAHAASSRPLLAVIDDAQWLDQESLGAMAFVARRLYADHIALIFAVRGSHADHDVFEAVRTLDIGALPQSDALQLLVSVASGQLDRDVSQRIVADTGGNPMAILELAAELSELQLAGVGLPLHTLPMSRRLEDHFLRAVRALPPDTQMFLLIAAAQTASDPALLMRAATLLGLTAGAADEAEEARLVRLRPEVEFRHPLIRSAVYGGAKARDRRRVHQALAEVLDARTDPVRRAWHRAAATVDPDESVADDLETAAHLAQGRGGSRAAVTFLQRAAELTPDAGRRASRLLAATQAALVGGAPVRAQALLEQAKSVVDDDVSRAQARRLEGATQQLLGHVSEAPVILLQAAREHEHIDRHLARETYLEALEAAIIAREYTVGTSLTEIARAALAFPRDPGAAPTVADLLLDGLATRIAIGYVEAVPTLRDAVATLQIGDPIDSGGARWSDLGSFAAQELWDFDGRRAFLERLCDVERKMGAVDRLRFTLVALGDCEMRAGRFAAAELYQLQARDLTAAINGSAYLWELIDVELLAWRGRAEDTRRRAEALIAVAEQSRAATAAGLARISLVVLELGSSRYKQAFTVAQQLYDDDPLAFGNEVLPSLVEAAVRSGHADSAEAACARLSERATASGTPWALGLLARSRALLATADDAEAHYNEAIERLTQTSVATDLAHAHLLYGEWLGRRKRRSDARGQLRKALDMFDTMGARAYAERTRAELVRTGDRVRDRSVETMYELTPQEEQVARLAAGGATNSEIAAQLFLSAATIDYHLRKVYKKLGVESRRDLVDVLPR
ncbi:MAG: hypothetical protein QOI08_2388 [Actinomycetota bacterium]|nr:hypothetical protein [Actinomycetota bacterium]